jgi:predicted aspartyl protease
MKLKFAVLLLLIQPFWLVAEEANFDLAFHHQVPLQKTGAGSYTVAGRLGGVEGEFLLDTGASMITVSRTLFKQVSARAAPGREPTLLREVAARTASGRVSVLSVYRVEEFTLDNQCPIGPVEVAVMPAGGRNLLGMEALSRAAPFAVYTSPPALGLSQCGDQASVAAR